MSALPDDEILAVSHTYAASRKAERVLEYAPNTTSRASLVYFHAGKFVSGRAQDACHFAPRIAAAAGATVLAVDYSLAFDAPFPAAVEDAHAAVNWAAHAFRHRPIFVIGEEAGGNLAAAVSLMSRDRNGPAIAGQILVMPMLDATLSCRSLARLIERYGVTQVEDCGRCYATYLPNPSDRTHPYASPSAATRLTGLPPALILTAHDDPIREEAENYAARLQAAGVAAELLLLPKDSAGLCQASDDTVAAIVRFISSHIPATPAKKRFA